MIRADRENQVIEVYGEKSVLQEELCQIVICLIENNLLDGEEISEAVIKGGQYFLK